MKNLRVIFNKFRRLVEKRTPWSVDRFGRLFAGTGTLVFTVLSAIYSPYYLIPIFLINLNLVITSFSDKCALRDLLKTLGAEEREKIYKPDGSLKTEKNKSEDINRLSIERA